MTEDLVKILHIVSVISWMAGLLYLPRLFIYHCDAAPGSEMSETFKTMERRLLKAIMRPAAMVTFLSGFFLAYHYGFLADFWMMLKIVLVLTMACFHGFYERCCKQFAEDTNHHSARFYRVVNEIPAVLMILVVALVVLKPF